MANVIKMLDYVKINKKCRKKNRERIHHFTFFLSWVQRMTCVIHVGTWHLNTIMWRYCVRVYKTWGFLVVGQHSHDEYFCIICDCQWQWAGIDVPYRRLWQTKRPLINMALHCDGIVLFTSSRYDSASVYTFDNYALHPLKGWVPNNNNEKFFMIQTYFFSIENTREYFVHLLQLFGLVLLC